MGHYVENPRGLREFFETSVAGAMDKLAEEILADADRLVPRDTESLANSGRIQKEEGSLDRQIAYGGPDHPYTGPGGGTVDYAAPVEYGHRTTAQPPTYVPARPFLRPAALRRR
jgi:phage gpG-like protein